ncbi:hypothetical protein BS47DRAFT_1376037 [Hydnum rufescens UP504]|uniref:Uncharacterized protein n=1 Tax=Hydnum rufescens UP504 TaxID=1448309 RepID=A0A9P6DZV3_9AGAM|nr:hypothetical protein BS47DRAFT_1376037 [Hydnum rufescens UP504]
MGSDSIEETSGRHHRDHSDGGERSKKRHRREGHGDGHDQDDKNSKKRKHSSKHRSIRDKGNKRRQHNESQSGLKVIDASDDEHVWVEKNINEDGLKVLATDIPTSESLSLTSNASEKTDRPLPHALPVETQLKRDDWMLLGGSSTTLPSMPIPSSRKGIHNLEDESLTEDYGDVPQDRRSLGGGVDFFSSLGTEHRKKKQPDLPDPDKPQISSRELNTQLKEGKSLDQYAPVSAPKNVPGGPGSQWRMKKLQRVYETAEEEGRTVEDVARERYDTLAEFEEAQEEKRIIAEREQRRLSRSQSSNNPSGGRLDSRGEKRWMFTDVGNPDSRPSSRTSFRRPGTGSDTAPSTPQPQPGSGTSPGTPGPSSIPRAKRVDTLRQGRSSTSGSGSSSPIPSVLTPSAHTTGKRALSPSSLNKLQARVLKAKLMGAADATELERQFEAERARANSGTTSGVVQADGTRVEVLPTLDGRGRLYDVGSGKDDPTLLPGNRKKKDKYVETRDPKTGEVLRINADDDSVTLGDMLRQERFSAGMADQKNLDAELAGAIMGDGKFEDDLEYMDDNAEKLGRKKMRSDAMKRQFAINDYARTRKALATCPFCYGEDDSPPKAPIVAMGTRAYLSCTLNEELVDGHCLIVPIQHHLSMLEGDDDLWDEVRNFMKCLIRMSADEGKGVFFYETVINLKWQKHTVIECVPVPLADFDELPAYFRESILASEAEWSQHKKLIDFSTRPGGFRRAMVPHLPYFMVQWDYKGEKGYGHVIEGVGDSAGGGEGDGAVDEGDKGGGKFPRYFAPEIIGNVLDLDPHRWRRPMRVDFHLNKERVATTKKKYSKYDWTGLIGRT